MRAIRFLNPVSMKEEFMPHADLPDPIRSNRGMVPEGFGFKGTVFTGTGLKMHLLPALLAQEGRALGRQTAASHPAAPCLLGVPCASRDRRSND